MSTRRKSFAGECFGCAGSGGRQLTTRVPCPSIDRSARSRACRSVPGARYDRALRALRPNLAVKLVSRSRPASGRPPAPAQVAVFEAHANLLGRTFSGAVNGHVSRSSRAAWPAGLSDREVEVLRLVCRGGTKKQVAAVDLAEHGRPPRPPHLREGGRADPRG